MPKAVPTAPPELDQTTLLVGWICASVVPHAISAEHVRDVLCGAFGRHVDATEIERSTDVLIAAGLAERREEYPVAGSGKRMAAASDQALPQLRDALAVGQLKAIVDALMASKDSRLSYDRFEYEAQLRFALLADDAALVESTRRNWPHGSVNWSFLAHAFVPDFIPLLPAADVDDALDACLAGAIHHVFPIDPVIAVACTHGSRVRHLDRIGYARVLQGRYDEFEALFDELPLKERRTKEARFALAATRALAATLQGNDDRALMQIEEALGILAGNRKRFVFPKSRAFKLSLLALVRADLPESVELLEKILTARTWEDAQSREFELVERAMGIKAKRGYMSDRYKPSGTLDVLFLGLMACWLGRAGRWRDAVETFRARAAAGGYAWVVAECDEILRVTDDGDGRVDGHARLGTVTLTRLMAPPPAPPRALQLLAQLAESAEDDVVAVSADEAERRLVWELHHGVGVVTLSAREQQRKRGAWSKGREAGVKRLSAVAAKEDYLLPQDRDAIAGAQKSERYSGGADQFLGVRSLYGLAGHPHVVDAQGRAVDIVRLEPELSIVDDANGGVAVRLEPYRPGTDGEYSSRMVGEQRCEVVRFAPAHRRLLKAIGPDGLRVPAADKARLLDTVSKLSSMVRVQSTVGGAAATTEVEADPLPWVWLEPLDAGLSVAVMVEPVLGSAVCFAPGAGGAVVFAGRDGESLQAQRDLDAEIAALDELVRDCPLLASRPTEQQRLNLAAPESCLELLEQLDAANARCKWPQGEKFRIVGEASTSSFRLRIKSAAEWFGVSGELVVDEERVLDLKELFQRLDASAGSRFLPLGDGQFLSLTDAFRRQLDDFAHLASKPTKGGARLDRLAVPIMDGLLEGAVVDADEEWRDWREERRVVETEEPALPSTLQAELRPYQEDGFRWLARLSRLGAGACLADDMGLGKTLQTLAVLLARAPDGPAIVVAPTSVVPNWMAETVRFAPTLNVRAYAGAAASRAAMLEEAGPFDLFVASYGVLQNDIDQLAEVAWHSAVLDEAQAIKNPAAKRTRAALRLKAAFCVVTTGTPVQNNLMDLYSLFGFVNPGLFGTLRAFRNRFLMPIERDGSETARDRLRRLIAPFVLRRLKTDVLDDLPGRTEITLHVKLSEAEASLYEALRQRAVAELEAAGEKGGQMQLLAHLTRLRLACCHPSLVMQGADVPPSSKLATFAATLDDLLANRHKVLVFSQFVMHLRLVEEHLKREGIAYQYLDGATPSRARTERINAFQSGDGDVFLISLKAGGTGLNLTAADYVIHMDPWWNPAVEDQASDRAHRIGQTRPVTIYRLVTEGTIEEEIVDLHHRKRDLAERLLEGADAPGRLDAEELMRLLRQPFGAEA